MQRGRRRKETNASQIIHSSKKAVEMRRWDDAAQPREFVCGYVSKKFLPANELRLGYLNHLWAQLLRSTQKNCASPALDRAIAETRSEIKSHPWDQLLTQYFFGHQGICSLTWRTRKRLKCSTSRIYFLHLVEANAPCIYILKTNVTREDCSPLYKFAIS